MSTFTRQALTAEGFRGWVTFDNLATRSVPMEGGVYVVWRTRADLGSFLERNPAGTHKGKNPTVPVDVLEAKWVEGTGVVNIGKATNLHERLNAYLKQGSGKSAGHFGGRYIWQCTDHKEFLIVWKATPGVVPRTAELELIDRFVSEFGRMPFANVVR